MYKVIQEQFNKVIAYSQGILEPNTDKLFADWLEAKRDFIEAFNGQLIYEMPEKISFELGSKEKELRLEDLVSMIENRYGNGELADFIRANKEGFFSNQVVANYQHGIVTIPKGMKLIRAFKFFEDNSMALEAMQNAASMIIQEDKVEGYLCLSVHPLDFLSTSENTHNWRSCHALDGEYRSGNLSHMVDSSTFICYLKSSRQEKLPNFPNDVPWNSKKWRVLFYMSDRWDMVFAGRQYPFSTETGLDYVKNKIFPKANLGEFSPWLSKKYRSFEEKGVYSNFAHTYVPVVDGLIPLNELMVNEPGSLQFNDVLSSSCYDALYAYRQKESAFFKHMYVPQHKTTRFHVGGKCNCTRCGEYPIEITSSFMCNECELEYGDSEDDMFAYCPCCGSRYFYDDGVWVNDDEECVCPNCAATETTECDCCGERYYSQNIIFSRKHDKNLCPHCWEEIKEEERNGERCDW